MAMDQIDAAENSYSVALDLDPSIRRSKSFKVHTQFSISFVVDIVYPFDLSFSNIVCLCFIRNSDAIIYFDVNQHKIQKLLFVLVVQVLQASCSKFC